MSVTEGKIAKDLLLGAYNGEIERAVSQYRGRPFHIEGIRKPTMDAMHPVAVFDGGEVSVFVKASDRPLAHEHLETEAKELCYLDGREGFRVPKVIDVLHIGDTALLIEEAAREVKPESDADFEILGRGLASLHTIEAPYCGFDYDTYLGIFRQCNEKKTTWASFFGECRLRDTLSYVERAGHLTPPLADRLNQLIEKLPSICPPQDRFSLLHGDPWLGNLMFDGKELVIIDCSLYYGNREIDLTTVDFFCPVSKRFFDAYNECLPVDRGFDGRRDLWKLNQWLGHIALFGEKYIPRVMDIIEEYI